VRPAPNFGPNPWHQTQWDWRAAANFVFGGAGSGLIVFAALSPARGQLLTALLLGGLALVGTGLACVWLEIGRPWRAFNVFLSPRLSWMTREAMVATLLFPVGLAAAVAAPALTWVAAALALAFVICQGAMVHAAKGIPAWRDSMVPPLIIATGLAEGGGLLLAATAWQGAAPPQMLAIVVLVLLARATLWYFYRRRLDGAAAPGALVQLDRAGRVLHLAGTLLPLLLIVAAVLAGGALAAPALALAGLAAAASGAFMKYTLVTRAAFNQGFSLAHLPVRGG